MLSNPGFIGDFLRGIFTALDNLGYFFLGGIFNIFFSIASAELFQGEVFNTFFERIQLILGVFMVFRLSITFLQIIVNPDMYKDKQSGAASLVRRVAVMLILLSVIVPITIPEEATNENPLNEKIASNGILFGFLYQIQESIVENNILGQLILGIDIGESGAGLETGGMRNVGQVLTSQVAQSFVTPTLNEGYDTVSEENFEEAAACPDIVRPYYNPLVTSGAIMNHITETCDSNGEVYAFDYTILGGFIVSVVMTIIVIGFTLDIAVRSIKLGILRLIAPIPIISYISPGQEKDGAFGNWVKTLTSTYLSLFVRLVIIYFGIYLIIILRNGELINTDGLSALAKIFVYIGILIFMKEAPKFFQDMLGLKGDGKLFSNVAPIAAAAGIGAGALAAGTISAATGNGFMAGASQVHGNGIVNKTMTTLRNLTPKQQELIKNKRAGKLELSQLHNQWKKGDKVYDKLGKNAFSGNPDDESYNIFGSREFAESKRAVDNANEHLKVVSARYNEAYSRGDLTQDLVDEYEKAQKSLKGKEATHESMRKLYSKDAKIEDSFKFRKYNDTDPTRVNKYVATYNSTPSVTNSNSNSSPIKEVPLSDPNKDRNGERTTPSGIIIGGSFEDAKKESKNRQK